MDYGIIFLIIIVIVIIIAIILIIYKNRSNTQNLLLTLPNYRIQNVATGNYLGLANLPNPNLSFPHLIYGLYQNPFTSFWLVLVAGNLPVNDPMGIWKIDIINKVNNTVNEVKIINDVYFNESPNLTSGFIGRALPGELAGGKFTLRQENDASIFLMTTIAPNTFNLVLKEGNLPITFDTKNNLLIHSNNVNSKPTTFKLTLV
jgi:hypothetical protein